MLGADDDCPGTWLKVLEVHELLQGPSRVHPGAPVTRDQPRSTRTLTTAGRQHHRTRDECVPAGGCGHPDPPAVGDRLEVGDRALRPYVHAGDPARSRQAAAYAGPDNSRRRSRRPYPVWWLCRGMPPAAASRSSRTTRGTPRARAVVAAASPLGPPPTTTTSTRSCICGSATAYRAGAVGGDQVLDAGRAEEPLAATHEGAGAPS